MQQAQQEARQSLSGGRAAARGIFRYFPGRPTVMALLQALLGARQEYLALLAQAQRMKEEREKLATYWGNTKNIAGISAPILPGSAAGGFARGRADAIEGALRMADAPKKKGAAGRAERRKPGAFAGADGKHPAALSRYQALDETRTLRECTQALCRRFAQYTLSSARAERYFCRQQAGTGTKEAAQAELDGFFAAFPAMEGDAGEKLEALSVTRAHGRWQADSFFRRSRR